MPKSRIRRPLAPYRVATFLADRRYLEGDGHVPDGIRRYQLRHGLDVTGRANIETRLHMAQARCAWADTDDFHAAHKLLLFAAKDGGPIEWRPGENPEGIAATDVIATIERAFAMWEAEAPVRFVRGNDTAPVVIGCTELDQVGKVLARAFLHGPIELDEAERWSISEVPEGNADLLTVLLHEIGHVLGLADNHSNSQAVMYGYFGNGPAAVRRQFTDTDRKIIRAVLGVHT